MSQLKKVWAGFKSVVASIVVGRSFFPWLRASPLLIVAVLAVYAATSDPQTDSTALAIFAIGMITVAASLLVGIAVGFLFGLPKALEQANEEGQTSRLLTTNSNLDKVSDWLTTILIGLGLVQLGEVASGVENLAESIAPALGSGTGAETVAVALLIYSAADGFLIGYLWTRIGVSIRLNEAAKILQGGAEITDAAVRETTPPAPLPPPAPPPP